MREVEAVALEDESRLEPKASQRQHVAVLVWDCNPWFAICKVMFGMDGAGGVDVDDSDESLEEETHRHWQDDGWRQNSRAY